MARARGQRSLFAQTGPWGRALVNRAGFVLPIWDRPESFMDLNIS
jgi:hypothetical protein